MRIIFFGLMLSLYSQSNICHAQSFQKEADFVAYHCRGEIEHRLPDRTRIDCLNDTHAIEYDWAKKWAEAIGQSLYYSAMTGKKAGIVLIMKEPSQKRYLKRLKETIKSNNLNIDLWIINHADKKPPKKIEL